MSQNKKSDKEKYFVCLRCGKIFTMKEHNKRMLKLTTKENAGTVIVDCDRCHSELIFNYDC